MTAVDPTAEPSQLRFLLRAMRSRNYRLYFFGQIVSLVGTWLSAVATSWLVYRLARANAPETAELMLGVVGFASQSPVFFLAPLAGVWIDRLPRRELLLVTQTLSMLQSFALAWLTLADFITVPYIIALSVIQGVINAIDVPARQSFVVDVVDNRDDLSNAIALNSSMVHSARMVGPALAGLIIYEFSEGACFLLDGFSYLAVLVALARIRSKPRVDPPPAVSAWRSLREGLRYAFGFPPIRLLLGLVAITSLVAISQSTLMPVAADKIFGGSERTLGLLLGSAGFGAFCGTVYLASRRTVLGLGRVIVISCATLGVGLIAFSASSQLIVAMPILMVTGGAMVVQMASANTVLQTIVDDDKRGRVMSLFTMSFFGMTPFGSLLAGWTAGLIGTRWTLTIAGGVCLLAAGVFGRWLPSVRHYVRPIYVRKGILQPEIIASAVQSSAPEPPLGT